MKIAVYAQEEFRADFAQVLQTHEVEFVDAGADLLEELRAFDALRFDRFVIMDEAVGDRAVLEALEAFVDGPRADRSDMLPVFVSNAFREQPSDFYARLVKDLGVYQVIACDGGGYDYFAALVRSLRHPLRRSDVIRLCPAPAQPAARPKTAAPLSPELGDYRRARRIAVAQPSFKGGSTHLSYAISSTLSALGFDVAVVVLEKEMDAMRRTYPLAPFDPAYRRLRFGSLDIYEGDGSNDVPDVYDYVVSDLGVALWIYTHDDPRMQTRAQAQLDAYRNADFHIVSSIVSPSCSWDFGRDLLLEFTPRVAGSTTFAVHGVPNEDVARMIRARIAERSENARFAEVPYLTAPLFAKGADPDILELLTPALPPKMQRRGQEPEPQPEPQPQAKAGPLSRLFRRKDFEGGR